MIREFLGVVAISITVALGYFVSMWLAIGLFVGAALIPGLILLLGDSLPLKGMFGNILFTCGQLAAGGAAIIYRKQGATIHPYRRRTNEIYQDGDWEEPAFRDTDYRLGLRPLAIGFDAEDAFEPFNVKDELPQKASHERPALLDETRGGYQAYTPYNKDTDGLVVHVARYIKGIGRTGTRLYNTWEEEALKKFGGDYQMSQVWLMALLFAAFGIMFVSTWILLGL